MRMESKMPSIIGLFPTIDPELCRIAAEQGDPRGQYLYSMMLIQGDLIAKDEHLSQYWLDKAYDQGFDPKSWLELMAQRRDI